MNKNNGVITIQNDSFFKEVGRLLAAGSTVKIPVKGSSMGPFLNEGDSVLLEKPEKSELRWGCIVLAKNRGQYVLHRLVGRKSELLELAGDNNWIQKELVSYESVLAVVKKAFGADQKELMIYSRATLWRVRLWYWLKPLRRVIGALNNKINN